MSPFWAPGTDGIPWGPGDMFWGPLFPHCLPSSLDFPVVCWFLLPNQPVGSHQFCRCAGASGLGTGSHHLQLLLHLFLGRWAGEGSFRSSVKSQVPLPCPHIASSPAGCAGLSGLPTLQGWSGCLHSELRGPHPRPQHSLLLLPQCLRGKLPAATLHPERGDH